MHTWILQKLHFSKISKYDKVLTRWPCKKFLLSKNKQKKQYFENITDKQEKEAGFKSKETVVINIEKPRDNDQITFLLVTQ